MIRIAAVLTAFATPLHAQPLCEALETLGQTGVADVSGLPPVSCNLSHQLDGKTGMHCSWPFAYRSDASQSAFADMLDQVSACGAKIEGEQSTVSHPDSYDQRLFQVGNQIVSVALKDKSALDETYIFLSVTQ